MKEKLKQAKVLNLTAGIVDIVLGGLASIGFILIVVTLAEIGESLAFGWGIIAFQLIMLALQIGCLLGFGIATIVYKKKQGQEYCNKKGNFLAFAIVETVIAFISLLSVCVSFSILSLIIVLLMIGTVAIRYVAYAFINKVSGKLDEDKSETKPEAKEVGKDVILDKIQKLTELKNSGAISEEEFEEIKNKLLNS